MGSCHNQSINFTPAPTFPRTGIAANVSASASSALAVAFGSSSSSVCTVNASTGALSLLAIGLCAITGDQAGNALDWNAAPQATQSFQVYNGTTAGLIFSAVTVDGTIQTPSCTGTIGSSYSCTVSKGQNNAVLKATINFANSSGTATIFSAQDQNTSAAYGGKNPGPTTLVLPANTNATNVQAQVNRNGSGTATITVTYTRPDGVAWTATLSTN